MIRTFINAKQISVPVLYSFNINENMLGYATFQCQLNWWVEQSMNKLFMYKQGHLCFSKAGHWGIIGIREIKNKLNRI